MRLEQLARELALGAAAQQGGQLVALHVQRELEDFGRHMGRRKRWVGPRSKVPAAILVASRLHVGVTKGNAKAFSLAK